MFRLGIALIFTALLALPAQAVRAEAAAEPSVPSHETAVQTDAAAPAAELPRAEQRRLTTAERWRGKPYLRSEDSLMRAHALDKALPPAAAELSRGALGLYSAEDEELRKNAMDRVLPHPGNQLLVGGF